MYTVLVINRNCRPEVNGYINTSREIHFFGAKKYTIPFLNLTVDDFVFYHSVINRYRIHAN